MRVGQGRCTLKQGTTRAFLAENGLIVNGRDFTIVNLLRARKWLFLRLDIHCTLCWR